MPSMSTLMGKRWFGVLRSARRLSRLRSRAHFLRFPPMRAPGRGDARALGKDALRCRVPARPCPRALPPPLSLRPMCHTHCGCYSMSRQSAQLWGRLCCCSHATPESPKYAAAASDHVRVRAKALAPREQRSSERAASGAMRLSRDGAALSGPLSYSATRRRTARVRVNLGARRRSLAFWTSPARATHAPQRVRGDRWAW